MGTLPGKPCFKILDEPTLRTSLHGGLVACIHVSEHLATPQIAKNRNVFGNEQSVLMNTEIDLTHLYNAAKDSNVLGNEQSVLMHSTGIDQTHP